MKKTRLFFGLFAVLLATGCAEGPLEPGALNDLAIGLASLSLSANELATISGHELNLTLTKNPAYANKSDVRWESSNTSAATVDQTGHITAGTTTGDVLSTVIKVYAVDDPSIYAVCPVSVYPDYGASRSWDFGTSVTISGDTDYGNGMTILSGTGSGSYTASPAGPGLYEIDPDDPYQYGLTPTGNTRGSMAFNASDSSGTAGFSDKSLRTGGMGRILKIAAIEGPFTVTVNYQSNGSDGRWADIRFGDKEGIRYQGDPATGTSSGSGQTVSWPYAVDDIVPFVYIEASAAIRIYDVIIEPGAAYPYTPVPDDFAITGDDSFVKGETRTYTSGIAQTLTSPVYAWAITEGGAYAEIVRPVDGGKSVEIRGLNPGTATLALTITTSNPYDGTVEPKTVTQTRTVTITGYAPVTSVTIDPMNATVTEGGTVQLTANVNPADATNPAYEWIITGGNSNGAIASGGGAKTVTLSGIATGSFTVKARVTTTDPAAPSNSHSKESGECAVTVTEAAQEVTWLFNAATAEAASVAESDVPSHYYAITGETSWGNGLTLYSGPTIRANQASGGITGCLQLANTSNFAEITGVTSSCTLEIKYSGTGGDQTGRKPVVTINGTADESATEINGTTLITWSKQYSPEGNAIILSAKSGAIRIYSIKITK
ncbi:MAG: Ig-like domain-containing protein [Spirochaetaceae bacterium]|jgi:uncharacterized protein YjdB|nr:Ig-like domain-containing protein [Spirochaetaceae bacterium]